jgi:hypothetical protein
MITETFPFTAFLLYLQRNNWLHTELVTCPEASVRLHFQIGGQTSLIQIWNHTIFKHTNDIYHPLFAD